MTRLMDAVAPNTEAKPAWAVLASLGVHGLLLLLGVVWLAGGPVVQPPRPEPEPLDAAQVWIGNSFEVDAVVEEPAGGAPPSPVAEAPADETESLTEPEEAVPDAEALREQARRARAKRTRARRAQRELQRRKEQARRRARERRRRAERQRETREAAAADAGAERQQAASADAGEAGFGQAKSPTRDPGRHDLARAFTRAVPIATSRDEAWEKVRAGEVGPVEVEFHLGSSGRIEKVSVRGKPPRALRNLIKRTHAFLGRGRYAMRRQADAAGVEVLRIAATVSRQAGDPDSEEPRGVDKLGHDPPKGDQRGRAYFVRNDGLRVDVTIELLDAP